MGILWLIIPWSFCTGLSSNVSSSPAIVNVGAIFSLNSTIGRVAKIAIDEAVKDVNSNSRILRGTKLNVHIQDSNCSGFLGLAQGNIFLLLQ